MLAWVYQHIEAVIVPTVHGVVYRVHAIEGRRYALHPYSVAKLEGAAPGSQQVARERQPAGVAAVAFGDTRVVGRYQRLTVRLVYHSLVGRGRDGVSAAASAKGVAGSHFSHQC